MCGENARGKVIQKLEFIENGWCFQIFLSLFSYYILEFQENVFPRTFKAQRRI